MILWSYLKKIKWLCEQTQYLMMINITSRSLTLVCAENVFDTKQKNHIIYFWTWIINNLFSNFTKNYSLKTALSSYLFIFPAYCFNLLFLQTVFFFRNNPPPIVPWKEMFTLFIFYILLCTYYKYTRIIYSTVWSSNVNIKFNLICVLHLQFINEFKLSTESNMSINHQCEV